MACSLEMAPPHHAVGISHRVLGGCRDDDERCPLHKRCSACGHVDWLAGPNDDRSNRSTFGQSCTARYWARRSVTGCRRSSRLRTVRTIRRRTNPPIGVGLLPRGANAPSGVRRFLERASHFQGVTGHGQVTARSAVRWHYRTGRHVGDPVRALVAGNGDAGERCLAVVVSVHPDHVLTPRERLHPGMLLAGRCTVSATARVSARWQSSSRRLAVPHWCCARLPRLS